MKKPSQKLKTFVVTSALVGTMAVAPMAAQAELGDQNLHRGMWDQDVRELQHVLDIKGYFDYHKVTGFFGPITQAGVKEFQKEHGLVVDGIVGPKTFAKLEATMDNDTNTEANQTNELLEQGDRGVAVESLQEKLADLGYYTGDIDGIFGPRTENAVTGFQKASDIAVDGIVGPVTRDALANVDVATGDGSDEAETEETNDTESGDPESNQEDDAVSAENGDTQSDDNASDDMEVVKTFTAESTAYTANCDGCSGITATGINLKENPDAKVISVDPDVIPLGSKVWVQGYGYAVAGDVGSSIDGKQIDVFFSDRDQAFQWGRRTVTVKVLK